MSWVLITSTAMQRSTNHLPDPLATTDQLGFIDLISHKVLKS